MSTTLSEDHSCYKCIDVRDTETTLIDISKECDDAVQFPPLDLREPSFRLIRLMPRRLGDSTISCLLLSATQAQWKGRYVAGSYVCGPTTPTTQIYINGTPFPIPLNLHAFLVASRDYLEARGFCAGLVMWIDAICIDQHSFTERNHQVSIMKHIFQNASTTFSWLGPATEDSDWLFDIINQANGSKEQIERTIDDYFLETSLQISSKEATPVRHLYDNTLELARRDYWGRLWILQELVLGPKILFLCGQKTIKLDVFTKWLDALGTTLMLSNSLKFRLRSTMFAKMLSARKVQFFTSTFDDLFEEFGSLKCSLVHDKIYALMSLLSDADNLNNKLRIRYEQPSYIVLRNVLSTNTLLDPVKFTRKALKELAVDALSKDLLRTSSPGNYVDYRPTWLELKLREDTRELVYLGSGLSSSNRLKVIHGWPFLLERPRAVRVLKVTASDVLTQHLILSLQDHTKEVLWGALVKPSSRLEAIHPMLYAALHVAIKGLSQHSTVTSVWEKQSVDQLQGRDRDWRPEAAVLKFPTHIFVAWVYICDLIESLAQFDGLGSELSSELDTRLRKWIQDTQQDLHGAMRENIAEDSEPSGVLDMPLVAEGKPGHPILYHLSRRLRSALNEYKWTETLNDRFISSARSVELT
jgi:hypothetical protein